MWYLKSYSMEGETMVQLITFRFMKKGDIVNDNNLLSHNIFLVA